MEATQYQLIQKEEIADLHFPKEEVLHSVDSITERDSALKQALALGNLEHTKIRIYFEDDKGFKMVETTVWGLTDKRVILKQGMVIPINRVHRIKF